MDIKEIKIGGKPFKVKYTFASYVAMHEKHGINVFDMPDASPRMVAVLIWGAVMHAEPEITVDAITVKLSMEEVAEALNICLDAIMNSLPKKANADDQKST